MQEKDTRMYTEGRTREKQRGFLVVSGLPTDPLLPLEYTRRLDRSIEPPGYRSDEEDMFGSCKRRTERAIERAEG